MNNSLPLVQYLEDVVINMGRHAVGMSGKRRFKSKSLSMCKTIVL